VLNILISAIKVIFLLGILVFIHELGHFTVAKIFKVRVNEFAIGFGPTLWKKQGKQTKYALRLIPLGGFVSMEGEEERSESEGSFSEAKVYKKILIVAAGAIVNIIFAIILYFFLVWYYNDLSYAFMGIKDFVFSIWLSLKMLFTGGVSINEMMGPVGISSVVAKTSGIADFIYILSVISLSLGVTNLLPFPPLDGGKIVLLIIEGITKKPINPKVENIIQMTGFVLIILLSIIVANNDILRIIK